MFVVLILLHFFFRSKNRQFFKKGITFSIITTGFAGMIFDLIIIFTFQSIYGYVFSWIGILVAFFMAGAACGAMIITTVLARIRNCLKLFIKIELAIICFSFAFPFVILAAHEHLGHLDVFFIFRMFFLVISFISGLLTGSQFPLANRRAPGCPRARSARPARAPAPPRPEIPARPRSGAARCGR